MKQSAFRNYVHNLYYEAMKERFLWRQPECPACEWFQASKWFIRKKYREEYGLD